MKIIFVTNSLGFGGAAKVLSFIANGLSKKYDVSIINFCTSDTTQKLSKNINIFNIKETNILNTNSRYEQIKFIIKVCKEVNPDIIVSFLHVPNMLSVLVGKILRIPVIISERGDPYVTLKSDYKSKIVHYLIYNQADGAVFQTKGAKMAYSKKLRQKGIVIPNPFENTIGKDIIRFNDSEKSIVFPARFEIQQKRQDIMIKAMEIIVTKHPDYILKFWGSGPDEITIKNLVETSNISKNIKFMGVSKNVIQDILTSRIFVLSSDYEGMPNALIEGMAAGLACISTDCSPGGARDIIKDNINGLLVPCGDFKKLAEAVCKMIEDTRFAEKCIENRNITLQNFNPDKILKKWEEYLELNVKLYKNKEGIWKII